MSSQHITQTAVTAAHGRRPQAALRNAVNAYLAKYENQLDATPWSNRRRIGNRRRQKRQPTPIKTPPKTRPSASRI
jgi:hypothetical protein